MLGTELPWLEDLVRAKRPARLSVVLTREEVATILQHLHGVKRLAAALLSGSGPRLLECLRLRVKDLHFARHEIIVRAGNGDRDRRTMSSVGLSGHPLRASSKPSATSTGATSWPMPAR